MYRSGVDFNSFVCHGNGSTGSNVTGWRTRQKVLYIKCTFWVMAINYVVTCTKPEIFFFF
jgi:hypothetical protein